jgi:hypothetical protein
MLSNKFQFIWESGFRKEDFLEINQSETRMACGGRGMVLGWSPFRNVSDNPPANQDGCHY